jgi:hypothetical protein
VSLQLLFTRAGSDLPAPDSLYKAFTIQLLSCILDDAKWYSLGSDTLYAISAKLRRRLRKMEHAGQLQCFPSSWVSHIRSSVSDCHTVMGEHWKSLMDASHSLGSSMSLSKLNARDDLDTKFPELDTFVSQIRCRQTMQISSMFKPTSKRPKFAVSKLPRTFHESGEYKLFELAAV